MSLPNTQPWPPLHFPRTPWPTAKSDLSPGYWVVGVNSAAAEYPTLLGQKYHPLTNATIFTFVFLITLQPQRYTVTVWLSHRMKQRCKIAQLVQFYYSFDIIPQQGFCLQVKSVYAFCVHIFTCLKYSMCKWHIFEREDSESKVRKVDSRRRIRWTCAQMAARSRCLSWAVRGGPCQIRNSDRSMQSKKASSEPMTRFGQADAETHGQKCHWEHCNRGKPHLSYACTFGILPPFANKKRSMWCNCLKLPKNEMYFLYSGKSNGCGICFYRNEEWWTDAIVRQLFSSLHQTSPRHLIIE